MLTRYRLDELGWYQFEWLCQSLLKSVFGIGIQCWGGHSDWGRDAYYPDKLEWTKGVLVAGPFIFQVKFVSGANSANAKVHDGLIKAVREECDSSIKRLRAGKISEPQQYVLMTNAPVSGTLRQSITDAFAKVFSKVTVHILQGADIEAMLDAKPLIRQSFPQLLGLRDLRLLLSEVVEKPILERSTLALERAEELARVFVPTATYSRALTVLLKHHFVVLTGPPEMGKTAIARTIGLSKHSQGWDYYECRTPNDFFQAIERARSEHAFDRKQVFVADDAFGSTEYRLELAQAWGADLDSILRALDKSHWMIWTSRPAPLTTALSKLHLQGIAEHFPQPSEVLVDANELTERERALILYRHSKSASLAQSDKELIKMHAHTLVSDKHFTPERIRRLIFRLPQLQRTSDIRVQRAALEKMISQEIANPTPAMRKSLLCLDREHQMFLIALLDGASGTRESGQVHKAYSRMFGKESDRNPSGLGSDLKDHFVRIARRPKTTAFDYDWVHPSWRDLVIELLAETRSLRQTFLEKCSIYGVFLALSIAGGGSGDRELPLLTEDDDWSILKKHLSKLAMSISNYQVSLLINTTVDLISNKKKRVAAEAKLVVDVLIESCRSRWKLNEDSISTEIIEHYTKATKSIDAPGMLPPLLPSLYEWIRKAIEQLDESCEYEETTSVELDESIRLAQYIKEYRPAEFKGNALHERLLFLAEVCNRFIKDQIEFPVNDDTKSELQAELERAEAFATAIQELSQLLPELVIVLEPSNKQLSKLTRDIERRIEMFVDSDDSDRDDVDYAEHDDVFRVNELFADL